MKKLIQRYSIVIVSIFICVMAFRLVGAYSDDFSIVEDGYKKHTAANLEKNTEIETISRILKNQYGDIYDALDAELIAHTLVDSIQESAMVNRNLSKLTDLKRRYWQIPVDVAQEKGGVLLKGRVEQQKIQLLQEVIPNAMPTGVWKDSAGDGTIRVRVVNNKKEGISGTSVCLRRHYESAQGGDVEQEIYAWCSTDSCGEAMFAGLDRAGSFSVIPVSEGYEYGTPQGTTGGTLGKTKQTGDGIIGKFRELIHKEKYGNLDFTFTQRIQRVRLIDDEAIRRIREDNSLTIRTPDQWKAALSRSIFIFLLAWWLLWGVMIMRRRNEAVIWPAALIMALTGIGLLGSFSFVSPLQDELYGAEFAIGIVIGVALMIVAQFIDTKKITHSPNTSSIWNKIRRSSFVRNGWIYYSLALLITLSLFVFGHSVGGMTVNLHLGFIKFQPSEIAKYLIVIFLASWFSCNIDALLGYSRGEGGKLLWHKARFVSIVFAALLVLLIVYMILGDMGPGMVLSLTFILLYSIIKSKTEGVVDDKGVHWGKLLKSDFSLLIMGIASFAFMLWIGDKLYLKGIFAAIWFVAWIVGFYVLGHKRFYGTAIMANAVIAIFVFAGNLFKSFSFGERFQARNEMASNTWGDLGLDTGVMRPSPNSQVSEGLWGLSSGGFWGQGLGHGQPNFIPAFHTDMVLLSIGEQLGLIGLALLVVLLVALLHHTIAVGYRSRNAYSLYMCLGIATVTAVQFCVIAFGSMGVIPLTGVVVPFLSYGKVSMILTLAAFGIVLSIEAHTFHISEEEETPLQRAERESTYAYREATTLARFSFAIVCGVLICVIGYYTLINRSSTLIRPMFVTAITGEHLVEYNPRIGALVKQLNAGSIYDRNHLLLATSVADSVTEEEYADCVDTKELKQRLARHTKRYYPFGDRLLFIVGDNNSAYSLAYNEKWPQGYLAESQHMSLLRGYDNTKYTDKEHTKPLKIDIVNRQYRANPFHDPIVLDTNTVVLRDYSALLPLLKNGGDRRAMQKVNNRKAKAIRPQDLYLTIDARLQCRLQNGISQYVKNDKTLKYNRLLRISVVVLDAQDGDLLASATYPLPNQQTLLAHSNERYYRDQLLPTDAQAYTDVDLGMVYPTAPGSTAKLMSAMSAFRKMGPSASNEIYNIVSAERIESGIEPIGNVTMENAIVWSSNCYFVNLVNHHNLFPQLDTIYYTVGANISGIHPYRMRYSRIDNFRARQWDSVISSTQQTARSTYSQYIYRRNQSITNAKKMNTGIMADCWGWTYGQGTLDATPIAMARVVSAIINGGTMPHTRFLLNDPIESSYLIDKQSASILKDYMHKMAIGANGSQKNAIKDPLVGGKTGTPERAFRGRKRNDGWFVFYVEDCTVKSVGIAGKECKQKHPLAVAVRMERLNSGGSGVAMRLSRDVVTPTLETMGYKSINTSLSNVLPRTKTTKSNKKKRR